MESKSNIPASTIASEVELTYKSKVKASERPSIKDSKDAYEISLKVWDEVELIFRKNSKCSF